MAPAHQRTEGLALTAVVAAAAIYAVPATMLIMWNIWMVVPVIAALPLLAVPLVFGLHSWIDSY